MGRDTDVIYTDCWPKEGEREAVEKAFLPYQVTAPIVGRMNPKGFFLPCPPITRGEEVSADSLSSKQYRDYEAKEFLLHAQNAILEHCLAGYGK